MADYTDEPSEDELKLLAADEANAAVPPAEDDDANPITPEQVAAEQGVTTDGTPAPAPAADTAPAADAATPPAAATPPPQQTDADRRAAFLAAHKDKTPEQLLELAFQQEGRANKAGFAARQSKESLDAIQQRATAAIARVAERRGKLGTEREQFNQQLQDDPDAATRAVHERLMSDEERQLANEELGIRRDAAVATVSSAFEGFDLDETRAFGAQMNYTPEELDGVTDVRDLATLHLAKLSGTLIAAGVIDLQGRLVQAPGAVAATDPRLAPAAPVTTLSSAPARGNEGGQSLEQQLSDIANMTDAQMEQMEKDHPGLIDSLLRRAN